MHAHGLGRFGLSLGWFQWFLEATTCPAVFSTSSQPLLPRFDTTLLAYGGSRARVLPRREAVLPPDWSARHLCHPYRLPPFCGLFQPFFPVGLLPAVFCAVQSCLFSFSPLCNQSLLEDCLEVGSFFQSPLL